MAIFEIGKVFTKEGEETRLAFLMTGTKKLFPEEEYSPYEAIGLMQDLLNLYSEGYTSQSSNFPFFHPNLQRLYLVKDEPIAYVGVLNPALQEKLEIKHKVILGEVKVRGLKEVKRTYKPLSTFPPAIRDITLLMDKGVDVDKLIFHIRSMELVEEVKMFSLYTDPRLGEGKKSVSLRLVFRSKEGTLSDQEVNEVVSRLLMDLEEKFGAKLR